MPANIDITINSALQIKNEVTPTDDHVLFVFKLGSDGKPVQGTQGFYSVEELIDTLGADATAAKKLAERYAKGTEGGVPVSSGEGYQDSAKYYKEQANALVTNMETAIELASHFTIDEDGDLCQIV